MFTELFHHRAGLSVVYCALWLARLALASAPSNDTCAGAIIIPTNGPFPYYTSIVDVRDATATNDPPAPSCRAVSVGRSVWYQFTPPTTRLYTISVSGDTGTTVLDTVMAIYTSSDGCNGPFVQFACNDDQGNCQSAISTTLSANVTYYIVVWMSAVSPPLRGMTSVQVRLSQPVPPSNDACAGAEVVPGSGPFPYLTSIADTTLATTTGDPPPSSCAANPVRSVWFRFMPALATTYELSLCTNTATTVYDTLMAIYTSSSGCSGPFTQIVCNHTNSCGNKPRSTITAALNTGVTYYIVAWESVDQPYIPGETSLQVRVALLPPLATTLPASSLTSTSALLNATVNPNGFSTSVHFEWGTTTNYGNTTAPVSVDAGSSAVAIAQTITGLQPGVTYHFRVVADNLAGVMAGIDRSFAWSATPPRFTSFMLTNGGFVLRLAGQPAQIYFIEATMDWADWVNLGIAKDLGDGSFALTDPNTAAPHFYRARAP
jgi:hypothetical protein